MQRWPRLACARIANLNASSEVDDLTGANGLEYYRECRHDSWLSEPLAASLWSDRRTVLSTEVTARVRADAMVFLQDPQPPWPTGEEGNTYTLDLNAKSDEGNPIWALSREGLFGEEEYTECRAAILNDEENKEP